MRAGGLGWGVAETSLGAFKSASSKFMLAQHSLGLIASNAVVLIEDRQFLVSRGKKLS
jgi:hypothetical protein